jgi:hypothetical protein
MTSETLSGARLGSRRTVLVSVAAAEVAVAVMSLFVPAVAAATGPVTFA